MVDKDGREQFINGIDSILQLQLEELKSDKEEIATRKDSSLANRRSFRYGMYAVVGLSVTSLIGLCEKLKNVSASEETLREITVKLDMILYFWLLKILGFTPSFLEGVFKRHWKYEPLFDRTVATRG